MPRMSAASRDDQQHPAPAPNDQPVTSAEERRRGGDRRAGMERRSSLDRRKRQAAEPSQFDRRRGPGRRRTEYRRSAEEGHMNEEQLEFIKAIDEYKRVNGRPFPTWTEVLDIVLYLGYRRIAPVGEFKLTKSRQTPE
jgi:hypothetical protein